MATSLLLSWLYETHSNRAPLVFSHLCNSFGIPASFSFMSQS